MCGVDLTRIDGIDVTTALAVLSETGTDMRKFASDKHFASWLGLCPGTKITGGKVMSGKTKRCANRAAQALRLAAAALPRSRQRRGGDIAALADDQRQQVREHAERGGDRQRRREDAVHRRAGILQ